MLPVVGTALLPRLVFVIGSDDWNVKVPVSAAVCDKNEVQFKMQCVHSVYGPIRIPTAICGHQC